MWNKIIIVFLLAFVARTGFSQQAYWLMLEDKPGVEACVFDEAPVHEDYLNQIKALGYQVIGTSKWFNAVCVKSDLNVLPGAKFIKEIKPLGRYNVVENANKFDTTTYGNSDVQLKMLGLDWMHDKGYTGKGVKLALFDAGFYGIDTLSCFQKLWNEYRIAAHYDFVLDRPLAFDQSEHGAYVLSIAGGRCEDSLVGAAPEATFYLARTEESEKETHLEEYYWVYAMEWAFENGVDIIHSSLGYSRFDTLQGDYTYEDMDGETTIITQATQLAISKGIFVTNSAGNEGDKEWKYITAPCDGKNVLCVGAVDSFENYAKFSSQGPSFDGRVKPEVTAMGKQTSYQHKSGEIRQGNGTSFSGPLIAGFVACLMEANPDAYNSQIFDAIIQSSDRYSNPDHKHGYGIPNAFRADSILKQMVLSQKELTSGSFIVSPNPAIYSLVLESNSPIVEYEIIDVLGKTVQSKKLNVAVFNLDVMVKSLDAGMYYVKVLNEFGVMAVKKFMKK